MIDGIRRKIKSMDKDPWDADQEWEPETETAAELPTDTAVLLAATKVAPVTTNEVNTTQYYRGIIISAIQNGGRYNGHRIAVPWLRMTLAGLEGRRVDPQMMWYGFDEGVPGDDPLPELPSYSDLFPSDRDVPAGPDPR